MLASSAPVAARGTASPGTIQTTRHITSAPGFPGTICGDGASPDDCLALVSLYNAFGGPGSRACPTTDPKSPTVLDPWHGWLDGETYCSWTGVECNDGGYVRTLQLPVSCQSGTPWGQPTPPFNAPYQLPPGIGRFVEVEDIYLPSIAINGTVPEQFANLTTLRAFVVSVDSSGHSTATFSGVIPDAIGKLTELTSISFLTNDDSGRQISGTLPASVAEMSSLTELVLGNTPISGSIAAGFFDKLVALETVTITGGQWRGPYPTKFASPALRSLSLGSLGNMTKTGTTLSIDVPTKGALVNVLIAASNFTSISADFINLLNVTDTPHTGCVLGLPDLSHGVVFNCGSSGSSTECANSTACTAALTVSSYDYQTPCWVKLSIEASNLEVHCIG